MTEVIEKILDDYVGLLEDEMKMYRKASMRREKEKKSSDVTERKDNLEEKEKIR